MKERVRERERERERERDTEEDLVSPLSIVQPALESEPFLDPYKLNIVLYTNDKKEVSHLVVIAFGCLLLVVMLGS